SPLGERAGCRPKAGQTRSVAGPRFPAIESELKAEMSFPPNGEVLRRFSAHPVAGQGNLTMRFLPNHLRPRREKVFCNEPRVPLDREAKVRITRLAEALSHRTEKG